jgi:hypothetical protein
MEKLFTYIILVTGLMILLSFAGITTTSGALLKTGMGDPDAMADIPTSAFWVALTGALALLTGVGGIIIGTLTRGTYEMPITAGIAIGFGGLFISDLISIVSLTEGWTKYAIYLILAPITMGYMLALYDWVRSRD